MITLLTSPEVILCGRVVKMLEESGLHYMELDVLQHGILDSELKRIIQLDSGDCTDIINKQLQDYRDFEDIVQDMKLSEFMGEVVSNPRLLRVPILLSATQVVVGYNLEDIESFIDNELRSHGLPTKYRRG